MLSGAVLVLNASIIPAFDQLDLLNDLRKVSYPLREVEFRRQDLGLIGSIDYSSSEIWYVLLCTLTCNPIRNAVTYPCNHTLFSAGYPSYVFHRPDLYNILLARVPADKISFNKRVVETKDDEQGVTIITDDGEAFHGDILIGADGVRSTIREQLYKNMIEKEERLPASDVNGKFGVEYICTAGTTQTLDPEKFPVLKDNFCHHVDVIGDNKTHSVSDEPAEMESCYNCG